MHQNIVVGVDGRAAGRDAMALADKWLHPTGACSRHRRHLATGPRAPAPASRSPRSCSTESETVDVLVCGSRHNGMVKRAVLGSTSDHLARHCACPLIVTPAAAQQPARRPARLPSRDHRRRPGCHRVITAAGPAAIA